MIGADVVVVGAGNAGLCAAISAAQQGAGVIVLDAAPAEEFGGNSALTMNMRFAHDDISQVYALCGAGEMPVAGYVPYPAAHFEKDLFDASGGRGDRSLIRAVAHASQATVQWLRGLGHEWQTKPNDMRMPSSVPIRLVDGGRGLQAKNFNVAKQLGIRIVHATRAVGLCPNAAGVYTDNPDLPTLPSRSVVLASGGFQASPRLREKFLGPQWEDARLRGVPFNDGAMLEAAIAVGAARTPTMDGVHATPQGFRIPAYRLPTQRDASQLASRYAFHLGITVDSTGTRFFDEGEDFPNFVYAGIGSKLVRRPDKIAFQLFSERIARKLPPAYTDSERAIRDFTSAAAEFDAGVVSDRRLNYATRDGVATVGLPIKKSNWASKIGPAPVVYPVVAGLTFTYGGLHISDSGHVLDVHKNPVPGLFACGEIVGGIFVDGYPGGSGMMAGAVFGRASGRAAAERALAHR